MKHTNLSLTLICISSFLLFSTAVFGQYVETFPTAEKGILLGPCPGGTSASCALTDFVGVNWGINGNFTGFDASFGVEDYLKTIAGVLEFGGDIDEELCYESPILDISTVAGAASFSVAIVWNGHDNADYVDVEYQVDGGTWIQIPNVFGGGTHTIDFSTSANSGSGTISQTGLSGSILSIRVCVDTNTSAENTTIDNVSVPEVGAMILPVELIAFTAKNTEDLVELLWSTATEINNEKFEIEHSKDGKQFEVIGNVRGKGTTNSLSTYSFNHRKPSQGYNYYRLKQVDFDGRFEYSDIVNVQIQEVNSRIGMFYPNPSRNGEVYLAYDGLSNSSVDFTVFDRIGNRISSQNIPAAAGDNTLKLDVNNFAKGVYLVEIRTESVSEWRKLIIN